MWHVRWLHQTSPHESATDALCAGAFTELTGLLYRIAAGPGIAAQRTAQLTDVGMELPPRPEALRSEALSTLIRLALAQGRLSHSLLALELLLSGSPEQTLAVASAVASLNVNQTHKRLPLPVVRPHQLHWHIGELRDVRHVAVASDGQYLYVHTQHGLLKVGTGDGASAPGVVYAQKPKYRSRERVTMACANGFLFVQSRALFPAFCAVVSCEHLNEVGVISLHGNGSVASTSNVGIPGFLPWFATAKVHETWWSGVAVAVNICGTTGVVGTGVTAAVIPSNVRNAFSRLKCRYCSYTLYNSHSQGSVDRCVGCRNSISPVNVCQSCLTFSQSAQCPSCSNDCIDCTTEFAQYCSQRRGSTKTKKAVKGSAIAGGGAGHVRNTVDSVTQLLGDGRYVYCVSQDASKLKLNVAKATKTKSKKGKAQGKDQEDKRSLAMPLPVAVDVFDAASSFTHLRNLPLVRKVTGTSVVAPSPKQTAWDAASGKHLLRQSAIVVRSEETAKLVGKDVTVEAWVRMTTNLSQWQVVVARYSPNSASSQIWLLVNKSAIRFGCRMDNGTVVDMQASTARGSLARWTHLVGVVDSGSSKVTLYVNGEPLCSKVMSRCIARDKNAVWTIGGHLPELGTTINNASVLSSSRLEGAVADVRMWSAALPQHRVQQCLRGEGGTFLHRAATTPMSPLVGWYRLDEGAGLVAHDSSVYKADGAMFNMAWLDDESRPSIEGMNREPSSVPFQLPVVSLCDSTMYTNGETLMLFLPPTASMHIPSCITTVPQLHVGRYVVFSLHTGEVLHESFECTTTCALGSAAVAGKPGTLWAVQFSSDGAALSRKLPLPKPARLPDWQRMAAASGAPRTLEEVLVPLNKEEEELATEASDRLKAMKGLSELEAAAALAAPPKPARAELVEYSLLRYLDAMVEIAANSAGLVATVSHTVQSAPASLSIPMTVELTPATFNTLRRLIAVLSTEYAAMAKSDAAPTPGQAARLYALQVCLRLFKANLFHLIAWGVSPDDCGLKSSAAAGIGAGAGAGAMSAQVDDPDGSRFVDLLYGLLDTPVSPSSFCAVMQETIHRDVSDALSIGIPVFCSTAEDRLRTLASLVSKRIRAPSGHNDGVHDMLMARYFETMAKPSNIVTLLSVVKLPNAHHTIPARPAPLSRSKSSGSTKSHSSQKSSKPMSEEETAALLGRFSGTTLMGEDPACGDLDLLLNHGLTLILQYTETALLNELHAHAEAQAAGNTQAVPSAAVLLPAHIASLRDFLCKTHTIILSRAMDDPRMENPFFRYTCAFAPKLVQSCAELLGFCMKADNWPSNVDFASTDPAVLARKQAIVDTLRQTVGAMLLSTLTTLWMLPADLASSTNLLPPLRQLLISVDALSSGLPAVVASERDYAIGSLKWMLVPQSVTVETQHPVRQGITQLCLRISGAKKMSVEMDPQSFGNGVTMSVYNSTDSTRRLLASPNANNSSFQITGDCCYISLNTGYNTNAWGFRAVGRATVEQEVATVPWLVDLQKCACVLSGRCAAFLINGGAPVPAEKAASIWLGSQLMARGMLLTPDEASKDASPDAHLGPMFAGVRARARVSRCMLCIMFNLGSCISWTSHAPLCKTTETCCPLRSSAT